MRLAVAQTMPVKGDIQKNIEVHKTLVESAASNKANLIVFPELSLTGYEPSLAKQLAVDPDDNRLDVFQMLSDKNEIVIATGIPTTSDEGIHISMVIFQPHQKRQVYSKQELHSDELPFFIAGKNQLLFGIENKNIAPAICYESLLPAHSAKAAKNSAQIYLASIAKSANGITRAYKHYPEVAKLYSMVVVMSNCVGICDNFESAGQSAIWNKNGELIGQLNEKDQGILMMDTETGEVIKLLENET